MKFSCTISVGRYLNDLSSQQCNLLVYSVIQSLMWILRLYNLRSTLKYARCCRSAPTKLYLIAVIQTLGSRSTWYHCTMHNFLNTFDYHHSQFLHILVQDTQHRDSLSVGVPSAVEDEQHASLCAVYTVLGNYMLHIMHLLQLFQDIHTPVGPWGTGWGTGLDGPGYEEHSKHCS